MRIKNLNDAIDHNRSIRVYKNSVTYRVIDWLKVNVGSDFTIHELSELFSATPREVSGALRNAKIKYGFIFEMRRIPDAHHHQFYHRLVDCNFKKPAVELKKKEKPSQSMWNIALSI